MSVSKKNQIKLDMDDMSRIEVLYGKLPGTEGQFARDPTGILLIELGTFRKKKLDVSYRYVQGHEERYHELRRGTANISLLVGRAALKHFLESGETRLLGCSINSWPYRLVVNSEIQTIRDLRGKSLSCRESIARSSPIAEVLQQMGKLQLNQDLWLKLSATDKEALEMLFRNEVQAALLPQPHTIIAVEKGFKRFDDWPGVVDDPLPLVIETTETQFKEKKKDFNAFIEVYAKGIVSLKKNRDKMIRMLNTTFGQSPDIAEKAFEDYLACMNSTLKVNRKHMGKLLSSVAPDRSGELEKLAAEWIVPAAL
jgi:hypothetical protein